MARFFIPDSVANEAHEREIPDHFVVGLPLHQAVAIIDAWDSTNICGRDYFVLARNGWDYEETDGIGALRVNTDRDHWYGIIYCPTDHEAAKAKANEVLKEWNSDEDDHDPEQ
jgi:hypothetical protein